VVVPRGRSVVLYSWVFWALREAWLVVVAVKRIRVKNRKIKNHTWLEMCMSLELPFVVTGGVGGAGCRCCRCRRRSKPVNNH